MPLWIYIDVCLQVISYIWDLGLQASGSFSRGVSPSEGGEPVPFTISPDIFSVFVGILSRGGVIGGVGCFLGCIIYGWPNLAVSGTGGVISTHLGKGIRACLGMGEISSPCLPIL